MRFAHPAAFVSLLTLGQSFLIPPTVSPASVELVGKVDDLSTNIHRIIDLECRNCPVAKPGHSGVKWVQGVQNKLRLDFSISQLDDTDVLSVNGFQLYPAQEFTPMLLSAPQISAITPHAADDSPDNYVRLGYELSFRQVPTSDNDHLEITHIHLQIVEINDKFVDALESIELKLLKATPGGQLTIGSLETAPTTNPGGKDCKSLTCKIKSMLANKFPHVKPTHGCGSHRRPLKALPVVTATQESEVPTGHHAHHAHHAHHGLGRLVHGLKRFARHILVPVFIGVCFGFTVSLIGMLVGRGIVLLWRNVYRRGQRKSCSGNSRCGALSTNDVKDQKESLLEHVEPPPMYEDAPADEKA